MLLAEQAGAVEQVLVGARLRERRGEPSAELGVVRQRAEEARIDQRIHHLRMVRQDVGEPRRGAEHEREQRDQIGILPQQRQQPRRAVQLGEEMVERTSVASGLSVRASCSSSDRQQLGQMARARIRS